MTAISELILLVLSFGALSSWSENSNRANDLMEDSEELSDAPKENYESKSLYDLMAHFPTDEGIHCPESDSRFRYPGECYRYITCRDFQAHVRSCPPGMRFDPRYEHCRLAFEVDCDDFRIRTVCGPYEVHSDCGCERTCAEFFEVDDLCDGRCTRGCFCRAGFVRNIAGECVRSEDCENGVFHVLNKEGGVVH